MSEYSDTLQVAWAEFGDDWYKTSRYDAEQVSSDNDGEQKTPLDGLQWKRTLARFAYGAPHTGASDKLAGGTLSVEEIFRDAARNWKAETENLSSATETITNRHYLRIIGLGKEALPLIFKDLSESGGFWFTALSSITGANPIRDEDAGRVRAMTLTWMQWGKAHGYC